MIKNPAVAKKSFGQHFLKDESVVRRILLLAGLKKGDLVLEIGPGTGFLTRALIETDAQITAIEADKDLLEPLKEKFGEKLNLLSGDAVRVHKDLLFKDQQYQIIANLPYNVASHIIKTYLSDKPRPFKMIVMVQKEVADRMVAQSPEMSVISVATQLYAEVKREFLVPPGAFHPIPKVQSAIVSLKLHENIPTDTEKIIALAKIGFSARRKMLFGNLLRQGKIPEEYLKQTFEKINLDKKIRAQELSIDEWCELYKNLKTHI